MEAEENLVNFSPLPLSLLSPAESSSSTESAFDGCKVTTVNQEDKSVKPNPCSTVAHIYQPGSPEIKDSDAALPPSHLDFLNLIFPPTPEKSPYFESGKDQEVVVVTTAAVREDGIQSLLSTQTTEDPKYMYKAFRINSDVNVVPENECNQPVPEHDKIEACNAMLTESTTEDNTEETAVTANQDDADDSDEVESGIIQDSDSFVQCKSKVKRSLTFPPCVICTGKASGSHYGAITCEACKGFFRRCLQKKQEFKCTKGGNCEIVNRNRGNCSGCRLQKCLAFGMSKEKSKLGRYTLTKRTETIKNMNRMQGKGNSESVVEENEVFPAMNENKCTANYDPESEMIGRKISQNSKSLNITNGFTEMLVSELVQAMNVIMPYGPGVKTKQDIIERHRFHSERYRQMIEVFGRMNTVPKDEYDKLYKGYGIDIDGRMAAMKICCKDMEAIVERYCNFAKHIPGFHSLPYKDQATLLKVSRADFFIIIMNDAFNKEYGTFIGQDGIGYHIEEVVDKFLSRELILGMTDIYTRWQMLEMSDEEKALIGALSLVFTDRCQLENHAGVEKIQFELVELIRTQLKKSNKATAQRRFTRIIDLLTSMRDVSELYLKEFNLICKDDIITEELPMLTEFFLEEYDNVEKK